MFDRDFEWRFYEPFSIEKTLEVLSRGKISKTQKYLEKVLNNPSFFGWLFVDIDYAKREQIKQFYELLAAHDSRDIVGPNVEAVYNLLRSSTDYPRSAAVVLHALALILTDECNALFADGKKDRAKMLFAYIKEIDVKYIDDIIKGYAKKLSRKTGVPLQACIDIVKNVPEKCYIDKDSVGGYMNVITDKLYTDLDEYDEVDDINWDKFFRAVVGEPYLKEVATYLSVESAARIKRDWKNKDTVQYIWESLTNYAINVFEEMPDNDREHAFGIYQKILNTMSGDSKNDLRIDLTKISEDLFPNIAKTVDKCYNKIRDAVKVAEGRKKREKHEKNPDVIN